MTDEPKILIAIPCFNGTITTGCAASIWSIVADPHVKISKCWAYNGDLVRIRSRIVREFLETDCTHLLFVDADISFEATVIQGMLRADKSIIGATYPYKRVDWDRLAERLDERPVPDRELGVESETLEQWAYDYPYHAKGAETDRGGSAPVDAIPMGCALLRRDALARMTHEWSLPSMSFVDKGKETVALFQLIIRDGMLLSEDYSFCHRARSIGITPHIYVGPGAPVSHIGQHEYRGHPAGVLERITVETDDAPVRGTT